MSPTSTPTQRVVVAMSGGVDSAVTAALLARQGYEVIGVTMRLFNAPFQGAGRLSKSCCSLEDVEDARATCRLIGARHYYMNFENEFRQHVIDYFVSEYERGRTPYPCLACNDRLKFHFLLNRALSLMDADLLATGHYARVGADGTRHRLLRAADPAKDQSYVLYGLTQRHLAHLLLPLGGYTKTEVRALAREMGLPVADKPDSQDICFIPSGDYKQFVSTRLTSPKPGNVIDSAGRVLAQHDGVHMFTIGQRRGLPLPGGAGAPVFVTGINAESATVTVGPAAELLRSHLWASDVNWVTGATPDSPIGATARIRYHGAEDSATITPVPPAAGVTSRGWARIDFAKPQRAITPGQAVVFYDGDECLGGGYIELNPPRVLEHSGPIEAAPFAPSPSPEGDRDSSLRQGEG